jgi:two-component system sensor histidine kinase DesK
MLSAWFKPAPDSLILEETWDGHVVRPMLFNLIWTTWVFADAMFHDRLDASWLPVTLASFALFLALYSGAQLRSRQYTVYFALALAALGIGVMHWNHAGGATYVTYACSYLAFSRSVRTSVAIMLAVVAAFLLCGYLQGWPWILLVTMGFLSLSIGAACLLQRFNAQKNVALRLSHEEIRRLAATAERERIGRDLHDLLGHTLSLITLKSELANRLFDRDAAAAKREMVEVERVARDALAQVRRAVTGIRAAGIAAEIASAKLLLESNGVHLDYALADVGVPVEIETALAMVVREAVTNIQRHARATRVRVTLEAASGQLVLRVEDDGRGGAIVPGNGLAGMRERLVAIGAQLAIDSQRGRGTRLTATLPLPHGNGAAVETAITLRRA